MKILRLLRNFFRLNVLTANIAGQIFPVPAGIVADKSALWGLLGFMNADNVLAGTSLVVVPTGSGAAVTLTAAQMIAGIIDLTGSPSGPYTVTTPTAAQIIAALGPNVPQDGSASFFGWLVNDGTGQTATLTAGTGVTVVNTATVATNADRHYLLNANVPAGTVTIVTLGGHSI